MFRVWAYEWVPWRGELGDGRSLRLATRTTFVDEAAAKAYAEGCVEMVVLPADFVPPNATPASRQSIRQEQER